MIALQYKKNVLRYIWVRFVAGKYPRLTAAPGSFLRLNQIPVPVLPNRDWVRVRPVLSGICGSDIAAIAGKSSIYLSAFTSFPFIPGHEVVGLVDETSSPDLGFDMGDRVVIEPALGCEARGIQPICEMCDTGHYANCERVLDGEISSGIQIGFCSDTGGGWSESLVVHKSQIHKIPNDLSNEAAVMIEPLSCVIHSILKAKLTEEAEILVVGGGTIGLLTVLALKQLVPSTTVTLTAKYEHQLAFGHALGADNVVRANRKHFAKLKQLTESRLIPLELGPPAVIGGFDFTFECTGSRRGIEDSLRWTRSQGTVIMGGMPAPGNLDLIPVWYQELNLVGSYAYGKETNENLSNEKTFAKALNIMKQHDISSKVATLVTHRFNLHQYSQAICTSMKPGTHKAIKTVFEIDSVN